MQMTTTVACALGALALAGPAHGATINVTTQADEVIADSACSLREAVQAANVDSGGASGCVAGDSLSLDTIVLPTGVYSLTEMGDDHTNVAGDLDLIPGSAGGMKVQGSGAGPAGQGETVITTSVTGQRVMQSFTGALTLENLTLKGNNTSPVDGVGGGGVVWSQEALTLDNVRVTSGATAAGEDGGGINHHGDLTIVNGSRVDNNHSDDLGGGIFGIEPGSAVTITSSTVEGNTSKDHGGGLMGLDGTVTITNSVFDQNAADPDPGGDAVGGAIALHTGVDSLDLQSSRVTGNSARNGGGGISLIAVPSASIDSTVIANNDVTNDSAATVGAQGGGVRIVNGTSATIEDSAIQGNQAVVTGSGTGEANGGGLMVLGPTKLERVSVALNEADDGGGGIYLDDDPLELLNVTLSGNTATGTGGGLLAVGTSTAELVHATVAANNASTNDGVHAGQTSAVTSRESIFDESATACGSSGSATMTSLGYSIDAQSSCAGGGTGDATMTDPTLEPLGFNGGTKAGTPSQFQSLRTHALIPESPADDHVPVANCTDDGSVVGTQDQRGFPRPFDTDCDAGAYELSHVCQGRGATLVGTTGDETLDGVDTEDDVIVGLGGVDTIRGFGGDDLLCGGADNDNLDGGAGDDTLDAGLGANTASFETAEAAVTVSMTSNSAGSTSGGQGTDTLTGGVFSIINGSSQSDVLNGPPAGNILFDPLGGDDVFNGGSRNDVVVPSPGDDELNGGGGNDILRGGPDDDLLNGGAGDDELTGNEDEDTASFAGGAAVNASLISGTAAGQGGDSLDGIENLAGSGDSDTLSGDNGANTLHGAAGNDTVTGLGGDDALIGGTGRDTASFIPGGAVNANLAAGSAGGQGSDTLSSFENLLGSSAGDVLVGNAADNSLSGFGGADKIFGVSGNDLVIGHGGDDVLNGGGGNDSAFGGNGHDRLVGKNGRDVLRGNAGGDRVFGGGGFDRIFGQAGFDRLFGNAGHDRLFGGAAFDRLFGGAGPDLVFAGGGRDAAFGGAGRDLVAGQGGTRDFCHGQAGRDRPGHRGCEVRRSIP